MLGTLDPPLLSGAFRNVDGDGSVSRSGYRFLMVVQEGDTGEGGWRAFAWPASPTTGRRSFCVTARGDVFATTLAFETARAHAVTNPEAWHPLP